MASSHLPATPPDKRSEPGILTDLTFDDDTYNRAAPTSFRILSLALLISVLAHVIILALAAYAATREAQRPERMIAQPSIQIRFRQPSQTTSTEAAPATDPVSAPEEETAPAPETASAEAIAPTESIITETATTPPDAMAETPPAPQPPRLQPPSLTDLRTAARNRAEQDRRRRSGHPDCLIRTRRSDYLDCGGEEIYDFASAGQNTTVAFFAPTRPTRTDDGTEQRTSTGARIKAAIDMVDNQLGTTQTKKRLMNIP